MISQSPDLGLVVEPLYGCMGDLPISRQGFGGGAIVLVISQSPDRGLVVDPVMGDFSIS